MTFFLYALLQTRYESICFFVNFNLCTYEQSELIQFSTLNKTVKSYSKGTNKTGIFYNFIRNTFQKHVVNKTMIVISCNN